MTSANSSRLLRLKNKLIFFEKSLASISLLILLILALAQMILRNLFDLGFANIDVIARHLVLFVALMGAALACENAQHIKMDFINSLLNPAFKRRLQRPLLFISALVCAVFFYYAVLFWQDERLYAPKNEQLALYLTLIIPVGFCVLSLHFLLLSLIPQIDNANT